MTDKFSKKMAQKGGLMIEALAMLGLIAVVTPTMYKKSAERALEVEDINTATTMRTYLGATNSLIGATYGDLIRDMRANNETNRVISINDLRPYLPYNFDTSKALYDFNTPKIGVHRDGNSLTAFLLFPAKSGKDTGLGQERTARIASMIGASGGYVSAEKQAKGIGGIWELKDSDFTDVFGNENVNVYSIVTASSDAINNVNTEEDTDKFLYRTYTEGEEWRNTMRADLFMGRPDGNDRYSKDSAYSIRDVKRLIIGAESAISNTSGMSAAEIQTAEADNQYGLYMTGDTSSAFVKGTLEAAVNEAAGIANLKADDTSLKTGADSSGNYAFNTTKDALQFGYNNSAGYSEAYNFQVDGSGNVKSRGNVEMAESDDWDTISLGNLPVGHILYGEKNSGSGKVSLINEDVFSVQGFQKDGDNYNKDFNSRVKIARSGYKLDENGNEIPEIRYNTSPTFPVYIGANTKVDGLLAARQIDAQKLRLATLQAGSQNIDDEYKWLTVDANGIHGRSPNGAPSYLDTGIDVSSGEIKMFTGLIDRNNADWSTSSGAQSYLKVANGTGIDMESTEQIDIYMNNDTGSLNIKNNTIGERLQENTLYIEPNTTIADPNTNVLVDKTNFTVKDKDGKTRFEVRGNNASGITSEGSNKYDVAVHGSAVFTSDATASATGDDYRYMTVGRYDNKSAVNIGGGTDHPNHSQVLTVDEYSGAQEAVPTSKIDSGANTNDGMGGGTVYVRKGMVAVQPQNMTSRDNVVKSSASQGYGVVQASRFVANNKDENGASVAVPEFFNVNNGSVGSDTIYKTYNGSSANRYDTYMVNPAYTSVMHDIKLTTRGGARLSDVLPDFITKGVYIVNNTYHDNLKNLKFKYNTGSITVGGKTPTPFTNSSFTINSEESWASPYLGVIPAPQCPPGYTRLVTMSPQSFMIGQAGRLKKGSYTSAGDGGYSSETGSFYYVETNAPDPSAYNDSLVTQPGVDSQAYMQLETAKMNTGDSRTMHIKGTDIDTDVVVTEEVGSQVVAYPDKVNQSDKILNPAYVLTSVNGDRSAPLTIQQSSWLKTNVVPVYNGAETDTKDYVTSDVTKSGYAVGWAALMGFIYEGAVYGDLISNTNNIKEYNSSGSASVYWNIFPVRRNTLEAYATTYCYFDRKNMFGAFNGSADFKKTVDQYDYLEQLKNGNVSFEKKDNGNGYIKRLNDPTLTYDEIW